MNILTHPDPRLSQVCSLVTAHNFETDSLSEEYAGTGTRYVLTGLVDGMFRSLRQAGGIGLAAPQVGVLRRIIITNVGGVDRTICNPVIMSRSQRQDMEPEGCLSYPGWRIKVRRPIQVTVHGQDIHGHHIAVQASGLLARCLQHEIDHLDGVCRVAPVKQAKQEGPPI